MEKSRESFAIYHYAQENAYTGLISLLGEWDLVAENKKSRGGKPLLPNLFIEAPSGIAIEESAALLAEYLAERGLMEFEGQSPSYAYFLNYSEPARLGDTSFPSFGAFYEIVEHNLSHYGHPYKGVLAIDITAWVEREATSEEKFLAFLDYMAELDERTLAIFVSTSSNESHNQTAYSNVLTRSRLKRIVLAPLSSELGCSFLEKELAKEGLSLTRESRAILDKTVALIVQSEGNEGAHSLSQLASEIAYSKYLSLSSESKVITPADLARFTPDGEWVKEYTANRKRSYGFFREGK